MSDSDRGPLGSAESGGQVARDLELISERRVVRVAGIRVSGRRRRPSGEKAPLPRELKAVGVFWLLVGVSMIVLWMTLFAWPNTANWWTDRDLTVLDWLVDRRNDTTTDVAKAIHALGSQWFIRPVRWAVLLILVFYRRWRHFFAVLITLAIAAAVVGAVQIGVARPRPFVEILASWQGYAHPSAPVASVSVTMGIVAYALIPHGTWRRRFLAVAGVVMAVFAIALMYLGVDHPSDGVVSALLGLSVAVIVFRLFAPEAVFPVTYSRGVKAHLDLGGARAEAIRTAAREQVGFEVLDLEPFGLEGSGGSTPLRIKVAGDPDRYIFGKLYAQTHLRSDRWYKLGRTILYGSQEDEVKFASVRRLVEYEDYILRVMRDSGLPTADPYGFVEITPEREYLILTEFLEGSREMTDVTVDDAIIDDGLLVVRKLWDAGLAHRDVKPANVLVRDREVVLIDTAFATVRPSPWRQAVDLANMMVILALRSDAERVYRRALRYFAPEDIAEAFAATRSITMPSQSRTMIAQRRKALGKDVVDEFRALAPPTEPIAIQRWSTRRLGLTMAALLGVLVLLALLVGNLTGGGFV